MMERIINRGAPPAITASGGVLVLSLASTMWYFETVAPGIALALLCCSALLLIVWCAWRQHLSSLAKLHLLEKKNHHLEYNHRQLERQFRQQADELSATCRNHQELVESANSIIIRWNRQGTISYANPFALTFFGYAQDEFIGSGLLETIVPPMESTGRDLAIMLEDIGCNPEHYISNENENICKDRRRVWVNWTNKAVRDSQGNTIEVLSVGNDITEKKRYERNIYQLAHYDQLTRLPNRNHLIQCLTDSLKITEQAGHYVSVLYLGLDRFKPINDSLGHDFGDLLLQTLAKRLQRCLPLTAAVARIGGDEFCAVLQCQPSQQQSLANAQLIADELLRQTSQVFDLGKGTAHITGSIGMSMYPLHASQPDDLIHHAETAMLRAKADSGNRTQNFESSMGTQALRRLKLANALRTALENDGLSLHYQPALNLSNDTIDYMEALLRWEHPQFGAINPSEFVEIAEESGLMPLLSRWVLNTATRQAASWLEQGYQPILMALNLSARQFEGESLLNDINDALTASGLPASCLGLEITESTIMGNVDYAQKLLEQINEMGITLLIDDFGTGHSSLARLRTLPVHTVKIDQSFVRDIGHQGSSQHENIIDAIITMAHGLNLEVIAEGVETEEQCCYLRTRGCDRFQGYLLAKAQPGPTIVDNGFLGTACQPHLIARSSVPN